MHYDAFISYNHSAQRELAIRVQRTIETFAKAWYRRRQSVVFRDQTDLAATPALWTAVAERLDRSASLVVLCAPASAESKWVDREIRHWLASRSVERIYLVLAEGELVWDDAAGDFDMVRSTALPGAFAGVFAEEPMWIDLRSTDALASTTDFGTACSPVIAAVRGVDIPALLDRHQREHRRTRRTIAVATTGFAIVLGVGVWQYDEAATNRLRLAVERSERAAADAFSQAEMKQAADAIIAARRALAWDGDELAPFHRTAISAAIRAMTALAQRQPAGMDSHVLDAQFSPDGALLATGHRDGYVRIWSTLSGGLLYARKLYHRRLARVAFAGPGRVVYGGFTSQVHFWWFEEDRKLDGPDLGGTVYRMAAHAPTGRVAVLVAGRKLLFLDPETARPTGHAIENVDDFELDPTGERTAVRRGDQIAIYRYGQANPDCTAPLLRAESIEMRFSPNGINLALRTDTGEYYRSAVGNGPNCLDFTPVDLPEQSNESAIGDGFCGHGRINQETHAWISNTTRIVRATKEFYRVEELDCLTVGDWREATILGREPAIADVGKIDRLVGASTGALFGYPNTLPGGYFLTSRYASPRVVLGSVIDPEEHIGGFAVHRSSRSLATLSRSGHLTIRDRGDSERTVIVPDFDGSNRYPTVAFSPSGQIVATEGAQHITVFDSESTARLAQLPSPDWDQRQDVSAIVKTVLLQAPELDREDLETLIVRTVTRRPDHVEEDGEQRCGQPDRMGWGDTATGTTLRVELVRRRQGGIVMIDCANGAELGRWPINLADDADIAPEGDAILVLKYGRLLAYDLPFQLSDGDLASTLGRALEAIPVAPQEIPIAQRP